jgi:predicted ATPase
MGQPDFLSGYQVERLVGTGAFATVWLAYDERLRSQVAIKVLADNWSRDDAVRERFFEEARLLRRLDDDHVVRVYTVGELDDGTPYMVMEWADRGTLRQRLDGSPEGGIEPALAIETAIKLLDGLAVVHSMGVVHRDVTPANVLFKTVPEHRRRNNDVESVLLGDLGLAKDLRAGSGFTLVAGTPGYMAPEQSGSLAIVDHRADLYSLAALLTEMLVGTVAFRTEAHARGPESMHKALPPAVEGPEYASRLQQVLSRGLAPDPGARFSSAGEMARALRALSDPKGRPAPAEGAPSVTGHDGGANPHEGLTNLAPEASPIVGRERELVALAALLTDHPIVTLTGAGGVGKTRLATAAARARVTEIQDGAWLVELATIRSANAVAPEVLNQLGVPAHSGRGALETLVSVLATQQRLIVLDNCEQVIDAVAALVQALRRGCPGLSLLLTSREPLHVEGEVVLRVPPLSLPPERVDSLWDLSGSGAVALFVERARAHVDDFKLTDELALPLASLCRRLDGMPLALELAAARLRSMSLLQILDRLDDRFALLTGGSRVAMARQRTLRATVDWSHDLLSPSEQALFRRLSVFIDGFDLDAAEEVCGFGPLGKWDVADGLSSLVDKSLVVADRIGKGVRYGLLETLHQYASESLAHADAGEVELVSTRHADHFLTLAKRAAPFMGGRFATPWLKRLDGDLANLQLAIDRALVAPGGAERVLDQFWSLRWFWSDARQPGLNMALLDRAMEMAWPELTVTGRSQALLCQGRLLYLVDRRRELDLVRAALDLARQADDLLLQQKCLCDCCRAYLHTGNVKEALECASEAVAISRQVGDPVSLGAALAVYAEALHHEGSEKTERVYLEALELAERAGAEQTASALHNNYAMLLIDKGDLIDARRHLELTLDRVGNEVTNRTMPTYAGLAWVLLQTGDPKRAAVYQAEVLRAASLNRNGWMVACAVLGLACCATHNGDLSLAAQLHGAADMLLEPVAQQWETMEGNIRAADVLDLKARLGQDFESRYADGRSMAYPDVVKLALSVL